MAEIENYLQKRNQFHIDMKENSVENIHVLLDGMLQRALFFVEEHSSAMTKADKLAFIKDPDARGAFLISKSGPCICGLLNISKFTLYSHPNSIRNTDEGTIADP